ncbi:MAG: ABC transporter permease [Planctomycetes bacterium]|nr:ABC transporter permease [Planctomycetota bacterium]
MNSPTLTKDANTSARRLSLADFAPLLTLAAVTLVFAVMAEDFISLGTMTLILKRGAVLAIVATGLTFVLLCAEIDLSVGTLALLSACICGVLWEQPFAAGPKGLGEGSDLDVCIVVAIPFLIALVLGLLSGGLTVSSGLPSFIITLAMMNIAVGLAKFLTLSQKYNVPPMLKRLGNSALMEFGTLKIPQSAALAAVVMLVAHLVLQHTRFGRYVYMTGGNRQAARLAGVRTEQIVVACLVICAWCAACGGLVNAGRLEGVSLDQNADLLLDAVACVVLGGTSLFGGEGGIGRTLIGVLTFTVLRVGLDAVNPERLIKFSSVLPKAWKDAWLQQSWVTSFDLLRPFLLGIVLLLALVIHGRLVKKHRD